MVWQVALMMGETSTKDIGSLLGMMPVWVQSTSELISASPELWRNWNKVWEPEPALTLFTAASGTSFLEEIREQIPMIEEHFPSLNCVRLFGVDLSDSTSHEMAKLGYASVSGDRYPGHAFARSFDHFQNLREFELDAALWQHAENFYRDFFEVVGAPEWHGHNFNALIDSIETGAINRIEVPYRLVIRDIGKASVDIRNFLNQLRDVFGLMQSDGCPVDLRLVQ